jgi:hypothetical protein
MVFLARVDALFHPTVRMFIIELQLTFAKSSQALGFAFHADFGLQFQGPVAVT